MFPINVNIVDISHNDEQKLNHIDKRLHNIFFTFLFYNIIDVLFVSLLSH